METRKSEERLYRSFDTRFISLRDSLRVYLKQHNIYYELSGKYANYHFEILCSDAEAKAINDFLDSESITEK